MGHGTNRVTQHKPTRESEAKEKAELKRENRALRKQLTRLRRQIQRLVETQHLAEAEVVPESAAVQEGASKHGGGCPECGSYNLAAVRIPSGATLKACKDCKHRYKEEKK